MPLKSPLNKKYVRNFAAILDSISFSSSIESVKAIIQLQQSGRIASEKCRINQHIIFAIFFVCGKIRWFSFLDGLHNIILTIQVFYLRFYSKKYYLRFKIERLKFEEDVGVC